MPLRHLCPMLTVVDIRRSIEFYRDTIGLELLNTMDFEGELSWAVLGTGERIGGDDGPCRIELMLTVGECAAGDPRPGRAQTYFYFNCDGVADIHARLRERGVDVGELFVTHYGMREFRIADPDGYQLWFGEDLERAS